MERPSISRFGSRNRCLGDRLLGGDGFLTFRVSDRCERLGLLDDLRPRDQGRTAGVYKLPAREDNLDGFALDDLVLGVL